MLEILALAAALQQQQQVATVVTVVAGETLSGIAGPNWPAVCKANGISNCNLIYAGQRINLGVGGGGTLSTSSVGTSQSDHEPDGDSDDPATSSGVAAPAPVTSPANTGGGGQFSIPGASQSLTNCIAFRESTNGTNPAAHGNVFGIIPASGFNVAGDSVAQQEQVAGQIMATVGPSAWSADGCPGT